MISENIKTQIINLYKEGKTNEYIANKLNIHRHTVSNCIKNNEIQKPKINANSKKYLNEQEILDKINSCKIVFYSISEIKKHFSLDVSERTLRRILKRNNFVFKNVSKKPKLIQKHIDNRLMWAKKNISTNWEKIIFSDEMTIFLNKDSNKCWYKKGHKPIKETIKHSKKYNVWACITLGGLESYVIFKENMDSLKYIEILRTNLVIIYNEQYLFQQDNSSVHKCKKVMNFFKEQNIKQIDFPSNSPDLNPIENLWSILKKEISKKRDINCDNFYDTIDKSLKNIQYHYVFNCISNMHVRIGELIKNKGLHINY